jgi:hypothetical protein
MMNCKQYSITTLLIGLMMSPGVINSVHANDLVIDDRTSGNLNSNLGLEWRLFTDRVMGGVSSGNLSLDSYEGRTCLRMQGDVSTENNGGFVQMALSLSTEEHFDASAYAGIEMEVAGNNELYNLHIRTSGLWFPWQSYRSSFTASGDWQKIRIPFTSFKPYKTTQKFRRDKLERIGLVGIGREFHANLCLASIRFYAE